jgi:hypothetical protein
MKKWWLVAALAALGVALGVVGTGSARSSGRTITLLARFSEYRVTRFLDTAPKSPTGNPDHISPGDALLQTVTLRNAAGRQIGTEYSDLMFFTASTNESSVAVERAVYVLGDGKLFAEAVAGPGVPEGDAIVGGTGAYAGARGTVTDEVLTAKKEIRLSIRLLP